MPDFTSGDRFGSYTLEEALGGGGFGDVWRARHVESGDVVALKFLGGQYSEADTARIHAEVELLATAAARSSRHVVRVLDGGTEPVPYVVMEYISGGDLRQELAERGSLTVPETLDLARGVLDALRVLDEAGIIHRDIKPANVMRDADGSVKLTDFGIAKIIGYDTMTATGQLPLSMAYAAPESWDGRSSHRSDLYSVGILLYQCLHGAPPFGGTYAEVYRQHLSERPDLTRLPPSTPPSLRALIARCLEKDIEARPVDAGACMLLLDAASSELEESTDPRGPRHPTRLGPWVIIDHHPTRAWTFRCQHEDTGRVATVEVHSGADLALGAALQRAVEVNAELVPLGAERLLETNRLVLRPGEAWPERTSGRFQFWVAREERDLTTVAEVDQSALGRAARELLGLRESLDEASLPFAPAAADLVWTDGGLHVRRPGLPGAEGGGEDAILAALGSWRLAADARVTLERSRSLQDLAERAGSGAVLGGPLSGFEGVVGSGEAAGPLRWAALGLALLGAGIVVVALLFLALDGGSGDGGIASPTATATPTEVVQPTTNPTAGPAPGVLVRDDFSGSADDWTLLGSAALDDGTLVLTTPRGDERGVAWLRAPVVGPFVADFDYRAGGALNSIGGHGLVFMFYKRGASAELGSGCLGFSGGSPCAAALGVEEGSIVEGYGVEFDGHLNGFGSFPGFVGDPSAAHVALVLDSAGQHLASVDDARVEDDNWHHVRVTVALDAVTVELDGEAVLTWSGELDRTFAGIGFAAATTVSETNWHIVDNVTIEVTGTPPEPAVTARGGDTLGLPQLEGRSCDLGATPASSEEGAATWVEFVNETGEPAVAFEVGDGLVQIARLEPGERVVHRGAVGDRWIVTDARGDCRVVFEAATTTPEPAGVWWARVIAPAGTRVYRNEGLGFEFLRPSDELVQVLSGASPGIGALSIGERIELFVVSARGADVAQYASGALTNVDVGRETVTSVGGLATVLLEFGAAGQRTNQAAAFLVRDDVAYALTFDGSIAASGCSLDLSTYRMLLSTFRFVGDPETVPTRLPGPDVDVSEQLCGDVLTPPAGAPELSDVIAAPGCGPRTVGVGDAVVCAPELSGPVTLVCWTVAGDARDCAAGPSLLTTSFDAAGHHPIELTACRSEGCQTAVVRVAVDVTGTPRPPEVTTTGCTPSFARGGAPLTCMGQVSSGAAEYCWSAVGAVHLDADDGEVRCGSNPSTEFRAGASGSAVITLRACDVGGLCSSASQLVPIDAAVAPHVFVVGLDCGSQVVLLGDPLPCGVGGPMLDAGAHLVGLTDCLTPAPFQPLACASTDVPIRVATTLAVGSIVEDGRAVAGARVDLVVIADDEAPLLRRTFSDGAGMFAVVDPPPGRYRLVVATPSGGGSAGDWDERASLEVTIALAGRTAIEMIDLGG